MTETYFETYHGKVFALGYTETAKCHDCHGPHNVLPPSDPESTLSRDNIVATCAQCHPQAHRQFAGYLTHATHHDKDKYPFIYWTWLFMTSLLVGTFTFFGIHTLLWLPALDPGPEALAPAAPARPRGRSSSAASTGSRAPCTSW